MYFSCVYEFTKWNVRQYVCVVSLRAAAEGGGYLSDGLKRQAKGEEPTWHMFSSVSPCMPMSPFLSDRHTAEQQNPLHKPPKRSLGIYIVCVYVKDESPWNCVQVCVIVCDRDGGNLVIFPSFWIKPTKFHLTFYIAWLLKEMGQDRPGVLWRTIMHKYTHTTTQTQCNYWSVWQRRLFCTRDKSSRRLK